MKEVSNSNKVFSDDNKDMKSANFQTEHMKNKIKNVKKRKKLLNIKNIEPLVNIHETPNNHSSNPNVKEGFTFNECDWTGEDNVFEGSNEDVVDTSQSFAKMVEDAFNSLETWYDERMTFYTTIASSDDKHINHDKGYLKRYFNWIVSIFIASVVVYNWSFIMFYRDAGGNPIKAFNVPREEIKKATVSNPFMKIVNFFTDIPFFITDIFKRYITDYFPDYILNKIEDPSSSKNLKSVILLLFMFILALSVFMIHGSVGFLKSILVDFAKLEFSGFLPIMTYIIIGILYLMTFIETNPIVDILPLGSLITFAEMFSILYWFKKIMLLIYLFFIGAPLSTAILFGYILFHSLFGMFYNGTNIFKTKTDFDDFLKQYKPIPKSDTACSPLSFFDKIINYMTYIFNYIYDNCIQIGIIIVMIYALLDSSINIKNNALKSLIMVITLACIVGAVIYSILINVLSSSNNESSYTNVPTPDTDKFNPFNTPNIVPTEESIPDLTGKLQIPTKETISDIAGKLNINDNATLQDGLNQMGNIASTLNSLKNSKT